MSSSKRSSKEKDPLKRPKTSHDFRRSSSHSSSREPIQPPKRAATPAIGSSSRTSSSEKGDKTSSSRGKRHNKSRAMTAVAEEDEDDDVGGGVDLRDPEARQGASLSAWTEGYGRSADRSVYDDGRPLRQGTVVPDVLNPRHDEFTEDESLAFWSWDQARQNWYHRDEQTGEILWAPSQFA